MKIKILGVGTCPKCSETRNLWSLVDDTIDYLNYDMVCSECFMKIALEEDVWMTFTKMHLKKRD